MVLVIKRVVPFSRSIMFEQNLRIKSVLVALTVPNVLRVIGINTDVNDLVFFRFDSSCLFVPFVLFRFHIEKGEIRHVLMLNIWVS